MSIQDFVNKNNITILTSMGEERKTTDNFIIFPNGWIASIVKKENGYTIAVCDYDIYFDWNILKHLGGEKGVIFCETEDEVSDILSKIKLFNYRPSVF